MLLGEILNFVLHLPKYKHTSQSEFSEIKVSSLQVPPVLYCTIGQTDAHFCAQADIIQKRGAVLAGFGKGYTTRPIAEFLKERVNSGAIIVRCARTGYCVSNLDNNYDEKYGFVPANGIFPHKAALLLSMTMALSFSREETARVFEEY